MRVSAKSWQRATGIALLVATVGLAGCYGPVYYREAPPPHAPAYGYRWHEHDYFYYPSARVYFHIHTGRYYYYDRDRWHHGTRLPRHIVVLPRDRVHIRVPDRQPWRRHGDHHNRYRPIKPQPRLPDRERHWRDRIEREQNDRLHREHRDWVGRGRGR